MYAVSMCRNRNVDAIVDDKPCAITIADWAELACDCEQFTRVEILLAQLHCNCVRWSDGQCRGGYRKQSAMRSRELAIRNEINLKRRFDRRNSQGDRT